MKTFVCLVLAELCMPIATKPAHGIEAEPSGTPTNQQPTVKAVRGSPPISSRGDECARFDTVTPAIPVSS